MPDLERMITKIYTYSIKSSGIYIDKATISRLNEFYDLIKHLRKLNEILKSNKGFPKYGQILDEFEAMI